MKIFSIFLQRSDWRWILGFLIATVLYGASSPETPLGNRNVEQVPKEKLLVKLQSFKALNEQNLTNVGPVVAESCSLLIENFDQNLLREIIKVYLAVMKVENTHHIFFELIEIDKKYPQQLRQAVKEILSPAEQKDFWERLEVAKKEATEGNG